MCCKAGQVVTRYQCPGKTWRESSTLSCASCDKDVRFPLTPIDRIQWCCGAAPQPASITPLVEATKTPLQSNAGRGDAGGLTKNTSSAAAPKRLETLSSPVALQPIVINEWMALNASTLKNPATQANDDWIELFNPNTVEVDISGYFISNKANFSKSFKFPQTIKIPPQGYLILWADDVSSTNGFHLPFKLGSSGETVTLYKPSGAVEDRISFVGIPQHQDVSQGRILSGDTLKVVNLALPTPGRANSAELASLPHGALVINEWLASHSGSGDDWIELFNPLNQDLSVAGYVITLGNALDRKIVIPMNVTIPKRSYLRVIESGEGRAPPPQSGAIYAPFSLKASGDTITIRSPLNNPALPPLDSITFSQQTNNISQGNFPNGVKGRIVSFTTPSPGAENVLVPPAAPISEWQARLPGIQAESGILKSLPLLYPSLSIGRINQKTQLADTPLKFFRAFPALFYTQLQGLLQQAQSNRALFPLLNKLEPFPGWCVGDAHIENFGTLIDSNNEAFFSFNDLDDGGPCQPYQDLLRLIVSIKLAGIEVSSQNLLDAYKAGLDNKISDAHYLAVLNPLLQEARKGGMRPSKSSLQHDGKSFSLVPQPNWVPTDAELLRQVSEAIRPVFEDKATILSLFQEIRMQGGSGGLLRLRALVQIGDHLIPLEFKEISPPAIAGVARVAVPPAPTRFKLSLELQQGPHHSSLYRVLTVAGREILMRPRWAGNDGVDVATFSQSDKIALARSEAFILGQIHSRSLVDLSGYQKAVAQVSPNEVDSITTRLYQATGSAFLGAYEQTTRLPLTYSDTDAVYLRNVPITANSLLYTGTVALGQVSITPPLPAGLTIDQMSGVISGTPSQSSPPTSYVITAAGGLLSTSIKLTVANSLPGSPAAGRDASLVAVYYGGENISPKRSYPLDLGIYTGQGASAGDFAQEISITNNSAEAVAVSNVVLTGAFTITSSAPASSISPYSKTSFSIAVAEKARTNSELVGTLTMTVGKTPYRVVLNAANQSPLAQDLTPSPGSVGALFTATPLATPNGRDSKKPFAFDLMMLFKARTAAEYQRIQKTLELKDYEIRLMNSLFKLRVGTALGELLIAANRADLSVGARLFAEQRAQQLSSSPLDVVKALQSVLRGMAIDRDGIARSVLTTCVASIPGAQAPLRLFAEQALAKDDVLSWSGLSTMGRIRLRSSLVDAYISTNPPLRDALLLVNSILRRLPDSYSRAPIINVMLIRYPELPREDLQGDVEE